MKVNMTENEKKKLDSKLKRVYRKMFLKTTFQLFLCDLSLNFISFFAIIFFSRAKKRTKMLMLAESMLTKKICKRQELYNKWEYQYFMNILAKINPQV